jgi:hypothetical protein
LVDTSWYISPIPSISSAQLRALSGRRLRRGFNSLPRVWRWDAAGNLSLATFREVLPHFDSANWLIEHFFDAGLPVPNLFREILVGGGERSPLYAWIVETMRSVWPIARQYHYEWFAGHHPVFQVVHLRLRAQECQVKLSSYQRVSEVGRVLAGNRQKRSGTNLTYCPKYTTASFGMKRSSAPINLFLNDMGMRRACLLLAE